MKSKKILVINAGSSSIKFQLYEARAVNDFVILAKGLVERIAIAKSGIITEIFHNGKQQKFVTTTKIADHHDAANLIINDLQKYQVITDFNEIKGIGHRIVHGGEKLRQSMIVNDTVIAEIKKCVALAPLHNPPGLKAYHAFAKLVGADTKHVVVFDTSFHATLPAAKYMYAVPYSWYQNYQVRRYGFHGISYRYIVASLSRILYKPVKEINAIICHLGNGASICAVRGGVSFNTSMGLTPLDGLMMGTRSGGIDPSIIGHVVEQKESFSTVMTALNKESGLLGISGVSSDLRDVIAAANAGHERAKLALTMFVERIANYIVMYANELENKVDALVFTAGIGENASQIRTMVVEKSKLLHLALQNTKNVADYDDYLLISSPESTIPVYKIRTNEEIMICEDVYRLIN